MAKICKLGIFWPRKVA